MSEITQLKRTCLHEEHLALKAKMVPFGGWDMPVQYEGILAEYEQTRKRVSVFDTSHMGEFFIDGDAVACGFDRLVTQPIAQMPLKACHYGALLNESGGIIDDLIVYRLAAERWMIVVNAGTMEKDEAQFTKHLNSSARFVNRSDQIGKLDIQGPLSRELLSPLVKGIEKLEYYTFDEFNVLGERVMVSRTGYTGELGYEIYFPWDKTAQLWKEILKRGAKPAGLGVRDLLRLEMGYSLYGHELEEHISPLDAGLNRFIDWNKEFIGKEALLRQKNAGVKRKVVLFVSESRRSPRAGHRLYSSEGQEIGEVTSGSFSPNFNCGIGMGFVAKDRGSVGERIFFGDSEQRFAARIEARPLYKQGSLKN